MYWEIQNLSTFLPLLNISTSFLDTKDRKALANAWRMAQAWAALRTARPDIIILLSLADRAVPFQPPSTVAIISNVLSKPRKFRGVMTVYLA